jgi:hypothetical protein
MDMANLLIGAVMVAIGVLGVVYLTGALALTQQPELPGEHGVVYPGVDRLIVPLLLPIGAVAGILAIIYLFSRILLAVPEKAAVGVALLVALGILLVCAALASARRVTRALIVTVIGIPLLVLVVAGVIAAIHLQMAAR